MLPWQGRLTPAYRGATSEVAFKIVSRSLVFFIPALFSATVALAQPASMDLTYPWAVGGSANVMGGVYVGPYQATINSGPPTNVICDDFFDDSYSNELWAANLVTGANAYNTATRMATNTGFSSGSAQLATDYDEVGYLAVQMLSATDPTTIGELDFALWSVFDPTQALPYGESHGPNPITTTGTNISLPPSSPYYTMGELGMVDYYLAQAQAYAAGTNPSGDISEFTVYYTNSSPQSPSNVGPPQEFLVYTPEPTTIALLAVDLSGIAGLLFFLRRRPRQPRA